MLINVLILFVYPALTSYSYREPIDYCEVNIVYGFGRYWRHNQCESPEYSLTYTTLCHDIVSGHNYKYSNSDDFCVLYFWLSITFVILQFIATID